MELSTLGNAYFDSKKPWSLAKQPETRAEMDTVIALCVECIKSLSLIASPIMPTSAQKIWELLGNQTSLETSNWDQVVESQIKEGTVFAESTPLFRKVEDSEVVMQVEKLKSMTVKVEDSEVVMQVEKLKSMTVKVEEKAEIVYEPLKAPIVYDQFDQMDLRVGLVLEAVKVPKSKKLLKLTVDLGFEKRTIVSGIALAYEPEQLIGKKVILIANLPPATLMGIESQGMILAASLGKDLELPMIQNLAPGSTVA
jgi:methionyl-tRNA synthetase